MLFGTESLDNLRYIISSQGLYVDPGEVESIKRWAPPHPAKEVRNFLNLAGYYRGFSKFIHWFAKERCFPMDTTSPNNF